MQKLFGTDGIRSRAGEFPLDEKSINAIAASLTRRLAQKLGRPPRFVTGRDTRESGQWIEQAIHIGARSCGAEMESASVITTPGVAFITSSFNFDVGIVISASHNPFEDNGIKIFLPDGRKLDEPTERLIEKDVCENFCPDERVDGNVVAERSDEFHQAYIDHLADFFPKLSLNGISMIIDCANGASCRLVEGLFSKFDGNVRLINNFPNGRNINKDCGSLHLEGLQKAVVNNEADIGIAYDGDADRALFVDEKGNIIDGDTTLWILASRLKDEGRLSDNKVVATVMSNLGLEIALRSRDIELTRTQVGDKYVLDELLKTGAAIGGEQSGHIIFPHESLVGDGMLTTLFVLDALVAKQRTLSEAAEGFIRYPQVLINVKVRQKRPFGSVPEIAAATSDIDKRLDGKGRLLLRYSGTENLARVMIEGQDQAKIEEYASELAAVISSSLS
jgi:phosphoglucosamine mutase